ncbi:MAG: ABC transporter substrate-binding protein [Rubrobacter sp.]|nr:ABC transporter substrate-binding protein [Rubrobacter sp.]
MISAGLLGAGGCGGGETGSDNRLVFTFGPDPGGGLKKLVEEFNRQDRGFQVVWREMPAVSDEYFDRIRTQFQAGGGDVDVIGGDVIWPAQLAANGWIVDLSDRFPESERKKFLDGPIEANTYKGKIYGVPWFTDAGMFYYRKDLLEQAGYSGPPETYEELKEMALKVTRDTGTRFGYVFQGAADEGGVVDALEYVWNFGGEVLSGERVVIDSPEAAAGLQMRRSMITGGIAPQATANYGTQESQAAFTNGGVVFMRNWPFVYDLLSDRTLSRVRPEQVGISRIPHAEGGRSYSGLGGWNLFISSRSEKQEEAWEFIEWMAAPEQQKTFALESSRLPTLKELYGDEEIRRRVPVAALGEEAIRSARPRPVSPYYSDMSLVMQDAFNAALKGDLGTEEALRKIEEELRGIVAQNK